MPTPTKSHITPDRDAVITEIEIAAPQKRVFEAITNRDQTMQWGTTEAFQVVLWEIDLRVGGAWRFATARGSPGTSSYRKRTHQFQRYSRRRKPHLEADTPKWEPLRYDKGRGSVWQWKRIPARAKRERQVDRG